MVEMSLANLVEQGLARRVIGDQSVVVRGIQHDSRKAEPGDLFVAIAGEQRHGAEFSPEAIARGAVAVLCDHELPLQVPVLIADDVLVALSAIARRLYDDPTSKLDVVGITGTNGKTTTAYLVEAMLDAAGRRPAVFGTVNFRGPGGTREATHTTPMADDLMRLARWAVDTGATDLVLEVSSHGLAMHRADGVHFKVAAFTNLTHDHLDYHGDFEAYADAKRRLFDELAPETSVINVDDPTGAAFAESACGRVLRCSRSATSSAELRVLAFEMDAHGLRARVHTPAGEVELHSPLIGEHNLENLLVALGCGIGLGLPMPRMLHALSTAAGAPGRLERVEHAEVSVFVDYAHTPDALERVLTVLRRVARGRVFCVFGCGGDRDRTKRPRMGRAAATLADIAIATNDNPRTEPEAQILGEIESGIIETGSLALTRSELTDALRGHLICADRRSAIAAAIAAARPQDMVLIAGKGHEKYQIVGSRREPFDDCAEARSALIARGSVT